MCVRVHIFCGHAQCKGDLVTKKTELKHGDRIILGNNLVFRFCMPQDEKVERLCCVPLSRARVDVTCVCLAGWLAE